MKFPNAFAGVKKLYTSEILSLIALICGLITVFAAFFTAGVIEAGLDSAVDTSLGVTGVFTILTGILFLIAFILNLVGLSQAGKDDPTFKLALYATILAIVISAGASFVPEGVVKELLTVVNEIMLLLVSLLSITGIMSLSRQCMNAEMENRGKKLIKIITASIIVAGISNIVYHFFAEGAVVLGIVSIVIDLIASLIYLGYLNRARKMLAE